MYYPLVNYKRHFEFLLLELAKNPSVKGYYYILGYLRAGFQSGLINYSVRHSMTERAVAIMESSSGEVANLEN